MIRNLKISYGPPCLLFFSSCLPLSRNPKIIDCFFILSLNLRLNAHLFNSQYCTSLKINMLICLKLVSAIFYQIFNFPLDDNSSKTINFFFSSKKLFSFSRYSNFCILSSPLFFPVNHCLERLIQEKS